MNNQRDVELLAAPILLVLRVVWGLGTGAVLIYCVIGELAAPRVPTKVDDTTLRLLVPLCCGLGVLAVVSSLYLARAVRCSGMRRALNLREAGHVLLKSTLLAVACAETPALLGLVVRVLGAGRPAQFVLAGIALAGAYLHIPTMEDIVRGIQERAMGGADFSLAPLSGRWWQNRTAV